MSCFRTKKYVVDIILCQRAQTVVDLLKMPVAEEDVSSKFDFVARSLIMHFLGGAASSYSDSTPSKFAGNYGQVSRVFDAKFELEEAGLVSRKNDYSEIIASIAQVSNPF
jgi:hypothetical protein